MNKMMELFLDINKIFEALVAEKCDCYCRNGVLPENHYDYCQYLKFVEGKLE